jgi:hypothetical protein
LGGLVGTGGWQMTRTAVCPSGALVLRPVAGYRGRLHPDLRRQAAGQDRRPSRARRVPRLPPRRRHPRHPGPGPAVPVPAGPDHHRGRAAPRRHRVSGSGTWRWTPPPGRPAGLPRLRGPGRVHPGTHRGGVRAVRRRDRAARPGGGAAGLACRATDAQVRADPGGQRRVRGAAEDGDLTQLRMPGFPAGRAAGRGAP